MRKPGTSAHRLDHYPRHYSEDEEGRTFLDEPDPKDPVGCHEETSLFRHC